MRGTKFGSWQDLQHWKIGDRQPGKKLLTQILECAPKDESLMSNFFWPDIRSDITSTQWQMTMITKTLIFFRIVRPDSWILGGLEKCPEWLQHSPQMESLVGDCTGDLEVQQVFPVCSISSWVASGYIFTGYINGNFGTFYTIFGTPKMALPVLECLNKKLSQDQIPPRT